MSVGSDRLARQGHGDPVKRFTALVAADERTQFAGAERAAADRCHPALLVAELLVGIGLVAQLHRVARLDESDGAAGYEQLGLQAPVARQHAEQWLARLHRNAG